MTKRKIITAIFISLIFLATSAFFCSRSCADDLSRSFKGLKISVPKADPVDKKLEIPNYDMGSSVDFGSQPMDIPQVRKSDRAAIENEKKYKEYLDTMKKNREGGSTGGLLKIPRKYRWIVDVCALALFVGILSFALYRQQLRKAERAKKEQEEKDAEQVEYFRNMSSKFLQKGK
ncbi:hypothetical protein ACFL96_04940 [Thermoproteota archaeon]